LTDHDTIFSLLPLARERIAPKFDAALTAPEAVKAATGDPPK
jgi:hypothetical protein